MGKIHPLSVNENNLSHYKMYEQFSSETSKLLIMRLYNKCRKIYVYTDHLDRVVVARTSIECLISEAKLNKKDYVQSLIEKMKSFVEGTEPSCSVLLRYYEEKVKGQFDASTKNLEQYFMDIKDVRDTQVHDGKEEPKFINMAAYLIVFPVVFAIIFRGDKLGDEFFIRTVLLLRLLTIDPYKWNKPTCIFSNQRNPLSAYSFIAQSLPRGLEHGREHVENTLKGFEKALEV